MNIFYRLGWAIRRAKKKARIRRKPPDRDTDLLLEAALGAAGPVTEPESTGRRAWLLMPTRTLLVVVTPVVVAYVLMLVVLRRVLELPAMVQFVMSIATVISAAVAGVMAYWLGRRLAKRLADMDSVLQQMQEGDYSARTRIGAVDEVGMLAKRVNSLVVSAAAREKRIIENALTDPLTGLLNRTLFTDRVRSAIAAARRSKSPFTVAVLDLDRFKVVNDTLGHSAGDALLREVARRLKAAVREGDTVARLGGDEFTLLLTGGVEAGREVAARIMESMRKPLHHNEQLIDIGLSIGIAVYPDHGTSDALLLRHADAAMYQAKRQQVGVTIFDGNAHEMRRSYLSMLGEMRAALEGRQFELDFQPKLDLLSGLIVGVEGLVRWKHPVRGRIPPGEFIPFAEQTGFMRDLTRWVVDEGVRFACKMVSAGLPLRVSVNVTARDIQNPSFCAGVGEILRARGLDPKWLCLEITESGVVSEAESALQNLRSLAALGVVLSVDDFGTGYATLKQLQQLPVHELKIDRSFVYGMQANRGNQSIVRATVELAKQLGLSVVAEGVETIGELRALASMGCNEVQGYYLAKPMSEDDIASWVEMRHTLHASSREHYFEMLTAK